jgi:hypothetical protein
VYRDGLQVVSIGKGIQPYLSLTTLLGGLSLAPLLEDGEFTNESSGEKLLGAHGQLALLTMWFCQMGVHESIHDVEE